ncbi:unnamed protein product [Mucor fragilis]
MDKTLENELLHKVWPFTYKLYEQGIIAAKLGSNASTFASRDDRSLDVKIDTLYKFGQVELGCSAVAEVDVSLMDGEYLDDWFLKLSKAPRDMLCLQVAKNPAKMNHLRTFGLIVIGSNLEVLIMDFPYHCSISRVTRSSRFSFPNNVAEIAIEFIPLLEIVFKLKQAMLENVKTLGKKSARQLHFLLKTMTKKIMFLFHFSKIRNNPFA